MIALANGGFSCSGVISTGPPAVPVWRSDCSVSRRAASRFTSQLHGLQRQQTQAPVQRETAHRIAQRSMCVVWSKRSSCLCMRRWWLVTLEEAFSALSAPRSRLSHSVLHCFRATTQSAKLQSSLRFYSGPRSMREQSELVWQLLPWEHATVARTGDIGFWAKSRKPCTLPCIIMCLEHFKHFLHMADWCEPWRIRVSISWPKHGLFTTKNNNLFPPAINNDVDPHVRRIPIHILPLLEDSGSICRTPSRDLWTWSSQFLINVYLNEHHWSEPLNEVKHFVSYSTSLRNHLGSHTAARRPQVLCCVFLLEGSLAVMFWSGPRLSHVCNFKTRWLRTTPNILGQSLQNRNGNLSLATHAANGGSGNSIPAWRKSRATSWVDGTSPSAPPAGRNSRRPAAAQRIQQKRGEEKRAEQIKREEDKDKR